MDLHILIDYTVKKSAYLVVNLLAGFVAGWVSQRIWRRGILLFNKEKNKVYNSNDTEDSDREDNTKLISTFQNIIMKQTLTLQHLVQEIPSIIPPSISAKKSESDVSVSHNTTSVSPKKVYHLENTVTPLKMSTGSDMLPNYEELAMIFEEEHQRQTHSLQETLNIGRTIGSKPVKYYSKQGGGYATLKEINEARQAFENFKEKKLNRADVQGTLSIIPPSISARKSESDASSSYNTITQSDLGNSTASVSPKKVYHLESTPLKMSTGSDMLPNEKLAIIFEEEHQHQTLPILAV